MKYTIIEDCSPFYIRFECDGIAEVIDKSLKYVKDMQFTDGFQPYRYSLDQVADIMLSVPMRQELKLNYSRVMMFVTQPGYYYRAHKDGMNHRYSINYTAKILDGECKTSWYADEDLSGYAIDNLPTKVSRECDGFDKSKHTPIKSMVALPGECILFNTEIFHDFDNSTSKNERMVLTLRDADPGEVYFEDVRQRLFDIH